jgi:hypothetical protein
MVECDCGKWRTIKRYEKYSKHIIHHAIIGMNWIHIRNTVPTIDHMRHLFILKVVLEWYILVCEIRDWHALLHIAMLYIRDLDYVQSREHTVTQSIICERLIKITSSYLDETNKPLAQYIAVYFKICTQPNILSQELILNILKSQLNNTVLPSKDILP